MSATQQLSSFGRYYFRIVRQIVDDLLGLSKAQLLIGVVAGIFIAALQIRFAIIPKELTRVSILAVVYTYLVIAGCALVFYAVRAPWKIDEQRQNEINGLKSLNGEHQNQEAQKARRKLLRVQLSDFMTEGEGISWAMRTQTPGAHKKLEPWLKRVRVFLTEQPEFDRSHVARFDSEQLHALKEFITRLED